MSQDQKNIEEKLKQLEDLYEGCFLEKHDSYRLAKALRAAIKQRDGYAQDLYGEYVVDYFLKDDAEILAALEGK